MSNSIAIQKITAEILSKLAEIYPDAHCELNFQTPFELLVATILSAQTTDRKVNVVTEKLFSHCRSPQDCVNLGLAGLEEQIKSLGLFHNKAKNILATCRVLIDEYGGTVPHNIEILMTLPGVGRKTANVVASNAFSIPAIAVDTHVFRVANRIGLANSTNVYEVEKVLQRLIPQEQWSEAHHLLIWHGRRLCKALRPLCAECPLKPFCHYYKALSSST